LSESSTALWLAGGFAALVGLGAGGLVLVALQTGAAALPVLRWRWRGWRRRPTLAERIGAFRPPAEALPPEVLTEAAALDLAGPPWLAWQVLCGVGGVALGWLIFSDISPLFAGAGLVAVFLPRLVMRLRADAARWATRRAVRNLLISLRLAVGLGQQLARALQVIDDLWAQDSTCLAQRLRWHTQRQLAGPGPLAVFAALARDFRSRELDDLVLRLQASRQGATPAAAALRAAAESLEIDLTNEARKSIKAATIQLLFPMLLGLFPPILLLLLLPLAVAALTGFATIPR